MRSANRPSACTALIALHAAFLHAALACAPLPEPVELPVDSEDPGACGDPLLGSLQLHEGFAVLDKAVVPEGVDVDALAAVAVFPGGELAALLMTFELVQLGPWPTLAMGSTTSLVPDAEQSDGLFASGFLLPAGDGVVAGFTRGDLTGSLVRTGAGGAVVASLPAPGNFSAGRLDDTLLINGFGIGADDMVGAGLYAAPTSLAAQDARSVLPFSSDSYSSYTAVLDNAVVVGAFVGGLGSAENRFFVLPRPVVQTAATSAENGSDMSAPLMLPAEPAYLSARVLGVERFADLGFAVLEADEGFLAAAVVLVPVFGAEDAPIVGEPRPVVSVTDDCTRIVRMVPRADGLLLLVAEPTGPARLIRVVGISG